MADLQKFTDLPARLCTEFIYPLSQFSVTTLRNIMAVVTSAKQMELFFYFKEETEHVVHSFLHIKGCF